ncbi:Na+/H+ antiporter [Antrihabitans sp. YC3-6]|uniref:Na+/H+ antiporter n=1 Tax=Antrihabitans stalagmiti TaxID=2799499 RepID=A0A934NW36_9NOCA|nr:Na+/H+ antiporter [Antrihabitans stalagmiti]MBJ8342370.1 Na+/H+ antiporter [Antrihabitans stalagmiti]
MRGAELLIVIVVAVIVAGLAERRNLQAPLVLVAVGSAASFIPGLHRLELAPEVILGVVLPPLLYSTALKFSLFSFLRNVRSILSLGIGMVVITALAVGYSAAWLIPELTLGAALVLGAVVAPPDAVTAAAVGQKLGLPRRTMTVLTGESLVNDAAALTLFTVFVAIVTGTKGLAAAPGLFFVYSSAIGLAVGFVLSTLVRFARSRIDDPSLETVLGLVLPFAAYLAAEEINGSGVLAVVMAGFAMGHNATDASVGTRISERQVWNTVSLLLETFVFAYMGLQLKFVIDDVQREGLPTHHVFAWALVILVIVIAIRPLTIVAVRGVQWAVSKTLGRPPRPLDWRRDVIVSWTGMRGVVTLAAAGGVPLAAGSEEFPGRGVILAVAFVVAVGTLLIQGLTLPVLIRRLGVDGAADAAWLADQRHLARKISSDAAIATLEELRQHPPAKLTKAQTEAMTQIMKRWTSARAATEEAEQAEEAQERSARNAKFGAALNQLRHRVQTEQRRALIAARDERKLDDDVMREALENLDAEQAATQARL